MTHLQNIGRQIKTQRKTRGWSQADLGKRTGNGNQYISDIETGRKPLSLKKLDQVVRALGCEYEVIIREA